MINYRKKVKNIKKRKLNDNYYTAIENEILISDDDLRTKLAKSTGVPIEPIRQIEVFKGDSNEIARSVEFNNDSDD